MLWYRGEGQEMPWTVVCDNSRGGKNQNDGGKIKENLKKMKDQWYISIQHFQILFCCHRRRGKPKPSTPFRNAA